MLLTFATILILPIINWYNGTLTEYRPLTFEMPVISLMTLNLLGKMGFGAFGGFEYVAIHAGEARDAARSIGRSVAIARRSSHACSSLERDRYLCLSHRIRST
jgi:amino acid transporter